MSTKCGVSRDSETWLNNDHLALKSNTCKAMLSAKQRMSPGIMILTPLWLVQILRLIWEVKLDIMMMTTRPKIRYLHGWRSTCGIGRRIQLLWSSWIITGYLELLVFSFISKSVQEFSRGDQRTHIIFWQFWY